ncbi:hypothetical protein DINM_007111 [Dirofilaria immitis]|nr:hypothetical protein [Dirofilaria immitis]
MSSVYNVIISQKAWNGDQLAVHIFAYKELVSLVKELDMNQIDEIMDVTSICLKKKMSDGSSDVIFSDCKQSLKIAILPSLDLLRVSAGLLSLIERKAEILNGKKLIQKNWSINFRIVIRRLLQTRIIVHGVPSTSKEVSFDQYLPILFELSDELVSLVGIQWFESDPDFCCCYLRCLLYGCKKSSINKHLLKKHSFMDVSTVILCGAVNIPVFYRMKNFGGLITLPPKYTKNLGEVLLRLAVSCCEISLVPLECLARVICELPNLPSTTLDTIMDALKKYNNKANEEDVIRILDTLNVQLQGSIPSRKWCSAVSLCKNAIFLDLNPLDYPFTSLDLMILHNNGKVEVIYG